MSLPPVSPLAPAVAGRVSVVLAAHQAVTTIGEQLDALVRQVDVDDLEVVVGLNRCTDGTESVVERYRDRLGRLVVVRCDQRPGAAYARNRAIECTTGAFVLFADADDVVADDWAHEMCRGLATHDVVVGRLDHIGAPAVRDAMVPFDQHELPLLYRRFRYGWGGSSGCTRAVLERVRFDERYQRSGEDTVFAIDAQRAGFRIGLALGARCGYRCRDTPREFLAQRRSYGRGAAQVIADHMPDEHRGRSVDVARLLMSGSRVLAARGRSQRLGRRAAWHYELGRAAGLESLRRQRRLPPPVGVRGPMAVVALGRRHVSGRRFGSWFERAVAPLQRHEPDVDFTAPYRVPHVGGARFVAPRHDAWRLVEDQHLADAVGSWCRVARPGDVVVDRAHTHGLTAVAAARGLPTSVQVVVVTDDERRLGTVRTNLELHGVTDRVTVVPSAGPWSDPSAVGEPVHIDDVVGVSVYRPRSP